MARDRSNANHDLPFAKELFEAADRMRGSVEEAELDCSGMLLPAERRLVVNAGESPARRRFTLAHEVGHWVCQVLEGHEAPVYCRAADLAPEADRTLEREANVFAAELLARIVQEPGEAAFWRRSRPAARAARSREQGAQHPSVG